MLGKKPGSRVWLRLGMLVFVASLSVASVRSANACNWWYLCLDDVSSATWSGIKWVGNEIWVNGFKYGAFVIFKAWGAYQKFTFSCSDQDIGGISGACFPAPGQPTIIGEMRSSDRLSCPVGATWSPVGRPYIGYFVVGATTNWSTNVRAPADLPDTFYVTDGRVPYYTSGVCNLTIYAPPDFHQLDRLRAAMNQINSDTRSDFTYVTGPPPNMTSHNYQVSSAVREYVAYFWDGFSNAALAFTLHDGPPANEEAVTTYGIAGGAQRLSAPVTIWPLAYYNHTTDLDLAGVIVHEIDHTRFGAHTCGDGADNYEDGPYGTDIQWYARLAKDGQYGGKALSAADRDMYWALAIARLNDHICDHGAQQRLFANYLLNQPAISYASLSASVMASAASQWQHAAPPWVTQIVANVENGNPTIYGLSTGGTVWQSTVGWNQWVQLYGGTTSTGATITQLSTRPGDRLVYRADDGNVWIRKRLAGARTSSWYKFPAVGWVSEIALGPSGNVYGVGSDGAVYVTTETQANWTLVSPSPWADPSVRPISHLRVTSDNTVYGIDPSATIVRYRAGQPRWEAVAAMDVNVIDMDVLDSGNIYGVRDDHSVCLFHGSHPCITVAPPDVYALSVTSDGYIYGISPWDQGVYVHSSLYGATQ